MIYTLSNINLNFWITLNMSSANAFKLDSSKIVVVVSVMKKQTVHNLTTINYVCRAYRVSLSVCLYVVRSVPCFIHVRSQSLPDQTSNFMDKLNI